MGGWRGRKNFKIRVSLFGTFQKAEFLFRHGAESFAQGLTLASDIGHLIDKICKCPIDVSYKRTNVLLICYKGGHCPIISSFTRTSRSAFFFFFRAAEAALAIDRLEDIKFIRTQVCVTKHNETARYTHTICSLTNHFNERVAHK